MHRLILVSCLTTVLLSACGRKAVEPSPKMRAPKVPSGVPIVIPGLTIRCCRLGEENAAVVIAKGEFPDNFGPSGIGAGLEGSFWYTAYWRQFSEEIELHWKCRVFPDLTGTIKFESWPGEFWPGEAFEMHIHKSDLTKGIVFVVRHKGSPESLNAETIQKSERVAVGVPQDPRVAELSRIDVTQLIRPWRDLSVEQLTEAIASDEEIRSLTTIDVESQSRPEQVAELAMRNKDSVNSISRCDTLISRIETVWPWCAFGERLYVEQCRSELVVRCVCLANGFLDP